MQSLPAHKTGASSKEAWVVGVVLVLVDSEVLLEKMNLLKAIIEGSVSKGGKRVLGKMVEGLRL